MGSELSFVCPLLLWGGLCFVISLVMACVGLLFVQTEGPSVDSVESFDCGIDPLGQCRVPFALHFFLITIVFVVFDAEMLLALPLVFSPLAPNYWWLWYGFLVLLFGGLLLEFLMRSIDWKE